MVSAVFCFVFPVIYFMAADIFANTIEYKKILPCAFTIHGDNHYH